MNYFRLLPKILAVVSSLALLGGFIWYRMESVAEAPEPAVNASPVMLPGPKSPGAIRFHRHQNPDAQQSQPRHLLPASKSMTLVPAPAYPLPNPGNNASGVETGSN